MKDSVNFRFMDWLLKPKLWYSYDEPVIEGYRLIASKADQTNAGLVEAAASKAIPAPIRKFGMNPIKPYRDYYGSFQLTTRLLPEEEQILKVKFAIGYLFNNKVTTVDDYSNFGWLRLALERQGMLYPNLSDQKQLLDYLLKQSRYPAFLITRVYHYLQFDLYDKLTVAILERENHLKPQL